jgi:hypothetical protein
VAIFNRASEGTGNAFWQTQDDMAAAANAMLATDPAQDYFGDSLDSDQAFIEHIYLNTLNKTADDDAEGIAFWVGQLEDGASRGEVVADLVQAIESYGPDGENYDPEDAATVAAYNQFTNRVEVSNYMAENVDNPPANYAQSTAFDEDLVVTDDPATVTSAQEAVDVLAEAEDDDDPGVEGETFTLTADTDRGEDFTGTADNDFFDAPITQNPWAGGVSNSLSSADRLDGAAGTDTLHAELVPEYFGVTGDNQIDIQPHTTSIENVTFEAREINFDNVGNDNPNDTITVDAKWMTDINKIGSKFSDGNLIIENLTTLTSADALRNTDSITITMDHTDNVNTDGDASDLTVYFDEDYLLSDQSVQSQAIYYLLDQDADLENTDVDEDGVVDLLANINTNGLRFTVDGGPEQVIEFDQALLEDGSILNHDDFVAALQDSLDALIAAGDVPADTTLTVDNTMTRTTFLDDGSVSSPIPAIVLESQSTTGLESVGFLWVEELSGEFNVYGRLADEEGTEDNPVAINVELHKVGRDNEGGDLEIGGKHDEGIPDFYVDVLGDEDKPSNLGTITTNAGFLENVYISTHADYVDGETWASLTIRDGFTGQASVDLVDADDFLGDLTLGSDTAVNDLVVLTAQGGGDVWFDGDVDASGNAYSYTTGGGDDIFNIDLHGDAVDTIGESFSIITNAGEDEVYVDSTAADPQIDVSQTTMEILDNLSIATGSGDDSVELQNNYRFNINAGAGSDFVYIDSEATDGDTGTWVFSAATGPATFVDRVLYQADLTVTFAGFESTVRVETDADGNFIADQITINNAIKAAIDDSPELSRLLEYEDGTAEQQLTVNSLIDGDNNLAIELFQPEVVETGATGTQVNLSTGHVTALGNGLVMTGVAADSDAVATAADVVAEMGTAGALEGNIDETGVLNADFLAADDGGSGNATGAGNVNFSVINMANGANDLVVLDSNVNSANVLVIDQTFGKVSVVNYFDVSPDEAALADVGNHAVDYTAYLSNETSATDSVLSQVDVAVTLNTLAGNDPTSTDAAANSVNMFRFDSTVDTAETFDNLTGSILLDALNDAAEAYGGIAAADLSADYTADLVGTTQHHIVKVENDENLGEYKVFYLTSSTDDDGEAEDGDFTSATLLGTVDFGASINFQLVGSTAWETLIETLIESADIGSGVDGDVYPNVFTVDEAAAADAAGVLPADYDLEDTATNLAGADAAILDDAEDITATDAATVAEAEVIADADNNGNTTYDVSDTLAAVLDGAAEALAADKNGLADADTITVELDGGDEVVEFNNLTAGGAATTIDFVDDAATLTETEFDLIDADGLDFNTDNVITIEADGVADGDISVAGGLAAEFVLVGDANANVLVGSDQDDTIDGGADADTITGGEGADTMEGGDGNDTFVIASGDGTVATDSVAGLDSITDFTSDSGAADQIDLTGITVAAVNIAVTGSVEEASFVDDMNTLLAVAGGDGFDTDNDSDISAALVTANAGDQNGETFLAIDVDGDDAFTTADIAIVMTGITETSTFDINDFVA